MDNKTNYEQAILNAVIDRIDHLRVKSGLSMYKLAQDALISDSSLRKLYRKQTYPNILTIYRLCDALHISVSEFFAYETGNAHLAEDKLLLVSSFEAMSASNQRLILELIQNLK